MRALDCRALAAARARPCHAAAEQRSTREGWARLRLQVGYSVLMGPVLGIMMADYFIIKCRHLSIDDLYSSSPSGLYWYQVRSGHWPHRPRCLLAASRWRRQLRWL